LVRGFFFSADLAAHYLTVERERLKHDVKAASILVREYQSQIEPEVILAFASNHGIGAVRRLFRLLSFRHGTLLYAGCKILRGQGQAGAGFDTCLMPASEAAPRNGGCCLSDYARVAVRQYPIMSQHDAPETGRGEESLGGGHRSFA
jgi:hypothetical protein